MRNNVLTVLLFLFMYFTCFSQKRISDEPISFGSVGVGYGFYVPQGNMSERFGNHFLVGLNGGYKFNSNFEINSSVNYLFGENVKEFPIIELANNYGVFIGRYGDIIVPSFKERGGVAIFSLTKIFNNFLNYPNPNSGVFVSLGGGYMYHKIYMEAQELPYFANKDIRRGYDRLTGGPGVVMKIGYALHSNSQYFNLRAALEGYAFFTRSLRKYQFDVGEFDESRNDFFLGISIQWLLLIYKQAPNKEYYY